jgi:hypothetical protein
MSQNLRVATFVPIADPAVGNLIKATAVATANKRVPSSFAADDNSGGGGGGTPSNAAPIMNGTAAPGVGTDYSRADHVHPSDTSRAATSHTHTAANVTDFSEAVDDRVGALLVAGTNITLNYNDAGNALTINGTGGAPAGATTQVQFNDAGAFAGDADLAYDKATDTLYGGKRIKVSYNPSIFIDLDCSAATFKIAGTYNTQRGALIFGSGSGVDTVLTAGDGVTNGTGTIALNSTKVMLGKNITAPDVYLQSAADVVEINNGTAGTLRDLKMRNLTAAFWQSGAVQGISHYPGGMSFQSAAGPSYSAMFWYDNGSGAAEWRYGQNASIKWCNGTYAHNSTPDLGFARNAAGVLEVNNGTLGTLADLKLRHLIADGNIQIGKAIGYPTQQYLYFDDGVACVSFKTGGYQTIGIGSAASTPRVVMGSTLADGGTAGFSCSSQGVFAWGNNASDAWSAMDTNLNRVTAGEVQVGTTGRNALGNIKAANGTFGQVNVATAMGLYDTGAAQCVQFAASSVIYRTVATGHITVQTPGYNVSVFQSDGNFACNQAAYKPGGGLWADSSDQRIKSVYGDYDRGLTEVCALRPVTFSFLGNDGTEPPAQVFNLTKATAVPYENSPHYHVAVNEKKYAGLIAQEVELVMPEMVTRRDGYIDGQAVTDLRDLDTTPLLFAMINAIKQLKADNEALQIRLDALEATPGR